MFSHYVDAVSSVLIPHGVIQERVKRMARNILEDVLQERETKLASANICLTDMEQQDTINDLIIEEKGSFAGLMDLVSDGDDDVKIIEDDDVKIIEDNQNPSKIIEHFNYAMESIGVDQSAGDLSSYSIELSDLLADHDTQDHLTKELPGTSESSNDKKYIF